MECYRVRSILLNGKIVYRPELHFKSAAHANEWLDAHGRRQHPNDKMSVELCHEHADWICPPCADSRHGSCTTISSGDITIPYCDCECFKEAKGVLRSASERRRCAYHEDHAQLRCQICMPKGAHYYCPILVPNPHPNLAGRRKG